MVEEILKSLYERIKKAEEDLKKLDTLIEVAKEAGEDVTAFITKRDELARRIRMWKKALEKRLGTAASE